jgi:saxitoxin biosynthesis operon SxtJ-like protein
VATGVPARLTAAEGRRFGLVVGAAFLVLGAVLAWRGRPVSAGVIAGLGGLLSLAGLVVPTRLGPVQRAWLRLAAGLSKITTPVFMGVVYFVVLAPIGLGMRLFRRNPLERPPGTSFWVRREAGTESRADMQHQF